MMILDALRQVSLFVNTPADELQWVIEQSTELQLSPGERLITEGEPADYWYMLLQGGVRLTKSIAGQEALIQHLPRWNLFWGDPDPPGYTLLCECACLDPKLLAPVRQR